MLELFTILIAFAELASSQNYVVTLDYGSFAGAYSEEYNITYWQKIPYAAPPVAENRFRAPQPPKPIGGLYNSTEKFGSCPQDTTSGSEDCLYLGLYGRPWAEDHPLRPVVVTFHGGGFVTGGASFGIPPTAYPILNVSDTDMIFVYPNYRLNAFGFLPGKEIAEDPTSDLNVGLRDQQAALIWVQKYIRGFGGDPENVAVWGGSAGGGSVIAHVISKEHDPPLFDKAVANSPFWPKVYRYDSEPAQAIYDSLVELTHCGGNNTLQCLKLLDVQAIRNASLIITGSHEWGTSSYTWAPVLDNDFLPTAFSEMTNISAHSNTTLTIYTSFDGENGDVFVPTALKSNVSEGSPAFNSSEASFDNWLAGYLPWFSACELDQVRKLYPPTGDTELETYNTTYIRAVMIYRDTVLACPAYWLASLGRQGRWLGEYSIPPADHDSDSWWWNHVNDGQENDLPLYEGYVGAFASYFATGDPNALKLTGPEVIGPPSLDSGQEWAVTEKGFSAVELVRLKERCGYWKKMAQKIPI